MNVLFVAAENGALAEGKVGGVADVVRDLPPALAARGYRVTVVTPSHGYLHATEGSRKLGACRFPFRGTMQSADIHRVAPLRECAGVSHRVIHHPALAARDPATGGYRVYADDPPERPFATDGSRFACFGSAVAAAVEGGRLGHPDVLHLHDWHAAPVALLGRCHPALPAVGKRRIVFSIHNIAYQGVRPLGGDEASLEAWFPGLPYDRAQVADPRWNGCVNWMAAGVRLADRVHTVSPTYAEEIRRPGRPPVFYGGEGLEADLERVHREGRLVGILNGCRYPENRNPERLGRGDLMRRIRRETVRWSGRAGTVPASHFTAFANALEQGARREGENLLLTGVGRVGEQKTLLLRSRGSGGRPGLHDILAGIGKRGCYVLLGSGDPVYARFLTAAAGENENFIFVDGFSEACARALYASGDLFLMPSSFEPCGLGQMLAMRDGQPCVAHAVGGLKDTVRDGHNGFTFTGRTLAEQVDRFVAATLGAAALAWEHPEAWRRIRDNAAAARFTWEAAAGRVARELYGDGASP